jgi:homoserine O-acetyltransferase
MSRSMATILLLLALPAPVVAQAMRADTATAVLREFRFASGELLPEVRVHYRTLGRLRRDGAGRTSNAVLVLHGTGGSGQGFLAPNFAGELFAAGQPLDTARWYIVIPDNLGHGRSTKPSDGLRARFPRYGYSDMTLAQYRLLTERLGVNHLRLIIGTSMGCMHGWVWAQRWPDFMDAAVPLACLPTRITGRNRMWRHLATSEIRRDPAWMGGDYTAQPPSLRTAVAVIWAMGSAPLFNHARATSNAAADSMVEAAMAGWMGRTDANDLLYAIEASHDYDPGPGLGAIRARVLAINFADDEINPPELGLFEQLTARVPNIRAVMWPASAATRGHGTHSWPAIWKAELIALLRQLPQPASR